MKRQIDCVKIDSIPYYEISEELKNELIEEALKKMKMKAPLLSRLNRPTLKRIIFLPETDIPRRITSQVESIRRMFVPITLNCNDELPNECVEQKKNSSEKDDKEYFEEEIINNELKSETQSMNDSFFDINISDMSDIDCSN